jgi:hypothetical protein
MAAGSRLAMALAMWVSVIVTGCTGPNRIMDPRAASYVSDVPIPSGYRLRDSDSVDVLTGNSRIIRHVYRGGGRPVDVRNFYEAQMPTAGWVQRIVRNDNGHYNLQFEKQGELCAIDISPARPSVLGGSLVRIAIVPRNYGGDVTGSSVLRGESTHASTADRATAEASARP